MFGNVLGIQQKLERHCLYDSRREIFPIANKCICSLVKPSFSHIVWLCFGALLRNVSFWTSSSNKFGKVTQLSSRTMETGSRDKQERYSSTTEIRMDSFLNHGISPATQLVCSRSKRKLVFLWPMVEGLSRRWPQHVKLMTCKSASKVCLALF